MTYTNRMGDTYYLIEGRTKTGKVRYCVSKTLREGTLPAMPEGFEFSENINGVVSVRKIDSAAASVPEADVALARMEMARHPRSLQRAGPRAWVPQRDQPFNLRITLRGG